MCDAHRNSDTAVLGPKGKPRATCGDTDCIASYLSPPQQKAVSHGAGILSILSSLLYPKLL